MSFDLFFVSRERAFQQPSRQGGAETLGKIAAKYGGEFGKTFSVKLADENWLEFNCDADGGMLPLRRWDEQRAEVIFDLLKGCGWVAVSPQPPLTVFSCADSADVAAEIITDAPHETRVVQSSRELFEALEASFGGWAGYRDQVVKGV